MADYIELWNHQQRQEVFDYAIDLMSCIENLPSISPEFDSSILKKELIVLMYELQKENSKEGFDTLTRSTNFYGADGFVTPEDIGKKK